MTNARAASLSALFCALFVVGFTLMGFEMLGSRYLNPYFGGGITTWASLISVVLIAMMVGYIVGGYLVDTYPSARLISIAAGLAGANMMTVPLFADSLISLILEKIGDGLWGVLTASFLLSFVPVALLSACSPFVVRLLLTDLRLSGRTTGIVYSISTLGNVLGTLVTTFVLIPAHGTRSITFAFGIALILLSIVIYLFRFPIARAFGALVVFCCMGTGFPFPAQAGSLSAQTFTASYPEGSAWIHGKLFYAEMGADRVMALEGETPVVFWREAGCGPTAISQFGTSDYLVLCHMGRKLVRLTEAGNKSGEYTAPPDRKTFQDPNDCHTDGKGGVFFSDSGVFWTGALATGDVYHIDANGVIRSIVRGLRYANGVAYDVSSKRLLVSEHLAHRVWEYQLDADMTVAGRRLFFDVADFVDFAGLGYAEAGPDGIEFDTNGDVYVAIYGAGRIFRIEESGRVMALSVAVKFVTNIALSRDLLVTVGAHVNNAPPFPGEVTLMPRATMTRLLRDAAPNKIH